MAITKTAHFTLSVVSVPDFNLVLPVVSGTAFAGQVFSFAAEVSSIDQFAGEVVLSISGEPVGSTVTFLPGNTVTVAPAFPKSVQINIAIPANNSLVGSYDIVVKAESTVYNGQ